MADPSRSLHITLTGPGISIDRDVPEDVAAAVVKLVLGGKLEEALHVDRPSTPPAGLESLAELFAKHAPKRNPDKIALIAYHLKRAGELTFTKQEVRHGFRRAGEREPGNF